MVLRSIEKTKMESPIETMYKSIPLNLLELTKQGSLRWSNHGCTVESLAILRDADVYEGKVVKHKSNSTNPLINIRIQIITSDEDCYLLIGDNLINNVEVRRLRNYVQTTTFDDLSKVYQSLKDINEKISQVYYGNLCNFGEENIPTEMRKN